MENQNESNVKFVAIKLSLGNLERAFKEMSPS